MAEHFQLPNELDWNDSWTSTPQNIYFYAIRCVHKQEATAFA